MIVERTKKLPLYNNPLGFCSFKFSVKSWSVQEKSGWYCWAEAISIFSADNKIAPQENINRRVQQCKYFLFWDDESEPAIWEDINQCLLRSDGRWPPVRSLYRANHNCSLTPLNTQRETSHKPDGHQIVLSILVYLDWRKTHSYPVSLPPHIPLSV